MVKLLFLSFEVVIFLTLSQVNLTTSFQLQTLDSSRTKQDEVMKNAPSTPEPSDRVSRNMSERGWPSSTGPKRTVALQTVRQREKNDEESLRNLPLEQVSMFWSCKIRKEVRVVDVISRQQVCLKNGRKMPANVWIDPCHAPCTTHDIHRNFLNNLWLLVPTIHL